MRGDANDLQVPVNTHVYSDIEVGDEATFKRQVTRARVQAFQALTGDNNPLHMDPQYAATTRFRSPIAHGILVQSYLSTLAGVYLPGKHALVLAIDTQFRKPTYLGDWLEICGRVVGKTDVGNLLDISTEIRNQRAETVLTGRMKVQVLR